MTRRQNQKATQDIAPSHLKNGSVTQQQQKEEGITATKVNTSRSAFPLLLHFRPRLLRKHKKAIKTQHPSIEKWNPCDDRLR